MSDQENLAGAPAESAAESVYFRSLDQLAQTPEYEAFLHREFQDGADQAPTDDVSRRNFLGILAASMALAGLTSCRKPVTRILPFQSRPEDLIPGVPRYYATAYAAFGYGIGTLVKSSDGRPTKVEGNPEHPASRGATSACMQGDVLNLYDPARSKKPRKGRGAAAQEVDVAEFAEFARSHFGGLAQRAGEGLSFLLEPTTSPSLLAMVEAARARYPKATFHTWSPLHRDQVWRGSRLAFGGAALEAQWNFAAADVVLSLDCDFLTSEPDSLRFARDYTSRRKIESTATEPSRLYVAEAGFSLTGAAADHRLRLRASEVADVALALAAELLPADGALGQALAPYKGKGPSWRGKNWVEIVARDLAGKPGKALVVAGPRQPELVHALVHAINSQLGSVGGPNESKPVQYSQTPASLALDMTDSIRALAAAIEAGTTTTLVILGGNPVYDAPADLKFGELLARPGCTSVHLGLHLDETGQICDWHLPRTHDLEAWGDVRSFDGTLTFQQPLVAPLYESARSSAELLAMVVDPRNEQAELPKKGYDIVREHHRAAGGVTDFEAFWTKALHDGLAGNPFPLGNPPAVQHAGIASAVSSHQLAAPASLSSMEVVFGADSKMADGRFSNNAWMMELPEPITKLVWDNGALVSRATAEALGAKNGDVVKIAMDGFEVEAAIFILPGCADFSIQLSFGYGRRLGNDHKIAKGAGYDAYRVRTSARPWFGSGATVTRTGRHHVLATTQDHGSMEGRPLVREASLAAFRQNESFAPLMSPLAMTAVVQNERALMEHQQNPEGPAPKLKTEQDKLESLWPERDYSQGYQWGMVIDLNACTGCNACVAACVSENNIPTVGKDDCLKGREMHWLRIDRYFSGPATQDGVSVDADPEMVNQPVPCMQCENAPCEAVCPVAATMHSPEGLNDMAYNRCIGTRYCSNNCPYKVRRFNWFNYTGKFSPTEKMAHNPDVTVRSRGVMEKCTYCVQRIQTKKIRARNEGRLLRDGELTTACAQGCPTEAITFGNIADPESRVAKLKQNPLNYSMLSELNVKPRTTYLAKIRNPNPELAAQ